MEFLKDYDFHLQYHPGKANVVADALSRKTLHISNLMVKEMQLMQEFSNLNLGVQMKEKSIVLEMLQVTNEFFELIKERQAEDEELQKHLERVTEDGEPDFKKGDDGIVRFRNRVCIPMDFEVRRMVLEEAHKTKLSLHPGTTKMYQDLKRLFWWP